MPWRTLPAIRTPALQVAISAAVALALGLYLLIALSSRPHWVPFLAVAAVLPFLAIIIGDVRRFLLALILLEIPVNVDKSLFYDYQAAQLGAIGGLNVSLTTFCLAILYALWIVELLTRTTSVRRSWFRVSLPLAAYLAAVALSVVVARSANLALFELFLLFQAFLLYVYIFKVVQSRQDLLFVVTMLLVGLALQAAVMIGLRVIGHGIYIARIWARLDADGRVGGTIGSPNTAASYITLLLAPALGLLLTPLKRRYRWLAVLATGLGAVALVLTFSRGGWLACAVSVAVFCLLALYRGWLSPRIVLILAVIATLLFSLLWAPIVARLTGDDAGAAASRLTMARLAFRIIRDHPLLGIGAGNYATTFQQYVTAEFSDQFVSWVVHNKYLLVWTETGIIGLLAFVGFLLAHIRRGWQVWAHGDQFLSPLALGFMAAVVGQMAHMFFDVFHSRPQVLMLWLVAGLITAMRGIDNAAS